jgi:hypothetical protein
MPSTERTYEALFDSKENLFYRDARFIGQRTPHGEKVFWSRGNAWAYAGLALILESLPIDYPTRPFYLDLLQRMSTAVLATQQPDGFWYPSLKDPKHVPIGETSGTALFVLGLAWGVDNGVLDRAKYWPAVERGWNAVLTTISPDGAVGFVQPIGAQPETFDANSRAPYGSGAVLGAGSEILRALRAEANVEPAKLFAEAEALVGAAPDLSRRDRSDATGAADRAYLVDVVTRIAGPVLEATSRGELHRQLPVHDWEKHRAPWTHYEAIARTLAGIAPWLELGADDTPEGRLRAHFIGLARQSLINATDPKSSDYMNFGQVPDQPLVEYAYLASALLAAPTQLWEPLTNEQRQNVANALRMTRAVPLTHNNNWLLFPAMAEAALWKFTGDVQFGTIERAVRTFQDKWYLGDGVYGDGPEFHWDYYNSYVIHPMLLQVLRVADEMGQPIAKASLPIARQRAQRYAEILERLISPEGTFPVMGRSSAYRFAVFYHLAYMALQRDLPEGMDPGAVRNGITTVVRRMVETPGMFDKEGWLQLGAVGHQPGLQETYNATGSLYVALTGLVHLGLAADDPFWTAPDAPWTQKRIWAGEDVPRDHALRGD